MNIKKGLLKIIGAGAISLIILSGFTLVYNYSGVHIKNKSGSTDYKWKSHQYTSNCVEGFNCLRFDENGYNNVYSTEGKEYPDILVMGSSYMEATNVKQDRNAVYLLNELLHKDGCDMYAYNIGVSGHTIYHCANNLEDAVKEFQPTSYVIVETNTIDLNTDSMKEVVEGAWEHIPSYDSGILYYLQKIPCIKTMYKQMQNMNNQANVANVRQVNAEEKETEDDFSNALDEFLKKMKDAMPSEQQKLIILYHPTLKIQENGTIKSSTNQEKLELFQKLCSQNGIVFIDMTDTFLEAYEKEYILPKGFSNTAVGEGHLNAYGHKMIAEEIEKTILRREEK